MVTEKQFNAYRKIQRSGITNMFDINKVVALSHGILTREICFEIMNTYEKLETDFTPAAQPVGTNADGKFCARRKADGSPCICDADVNMNGGCVFWQPVKEPAKPAETKTHEYFRTPAAASGETMSSAYDRPEGYEKECRDCSVRALALAANMPYKDVHAAFKAAGRPDKHGIKVKKVLQKACKMLNLEAKQVRRSGSLTKLKEEYPNENIYVLMRAHAFPVIKGVAHDVNVNAHIKGAWIIKRGVIA